MFCFAFLNMFFFILRIFKRTEIVTLGEVYILVFMVMIMTHFVTST